MRKINLGCGPYKEEEYINIDINPHWNPDIARDVRKGLPFDSSSVQEIRAHHFLEHLVSEEILFVLEECYRVLVDNGILDIIVPLRDMSSIDHKTLFTETSFDHFLRENNDSEVYFNTDMKWSPVCKDVFVQADRELSCLQVKMRKVIK